MEDFVHLHVHSEYSLLDGAARIKKLVKTVKEMGMSAIAVTDHGNMYGAVTLYDACVGLDKDYFKKNGVPIVKPIFGTEFYVCDDITIKSGKTKLAHLIILAKNEIGYRNLCMLNTISFRDGYYYKPRIDYKTLKQYSQGLICLSACVAGDLPQLILKGRLQEAEEYAIMMRDMFAPGDFYIEVQDHGLLDEKKVYPHLIEIARKIGVKTVATNDVHYIYKEDAEVQDILMCVQMGKTVYDEDRLKFDSDQLYLKTGDEMRDLFPDNPECIASTKEIADKCNYLFTEIDKNLYLIPKFITPTGQTPLEYMYELIEDGVRKKYGEKTKQIEDRIASEMEVIVKQGFVEYYLTVWDYINAARSMGIPVGPGRGSGAGSIVAYLIGITNIDPLKYDLLFERFLHTERVTAPDFDVDFADDKRGEVIEYVRRKYGNDRVVKIVTFGTMAAKNAIKDVGRTLGVSYTDLDKVTKAIPKISAKHNDVIKKAFGFYKAKEGDDDFGVDYSVPELVEIYNTNNEIKKVIDVAMKLEGMPRQTSTHACGVVIGADVLEKFMPLSRNGEDITTQYSMTDIERLGHLKMDFLGLRNLNDIEKTIKYVKQNHGVEIDFDKMELNDAKVFELMSSGNTKAIFQIESGGFQKFMKELRPNSIEDITAGVSLYRPGPMDSIPRYVDNKNNPDHVKYAHPILEKILNVTYGCIVYQEQVMRIVQDMAGYTLGQADMVRRMMGKKKVDAMKLEKQVFLYGKPPADGKPAIDGAVKRGVPEDVASQVWSEMEKFAQYAFNKSHAAAYSIITYETAYLKCYYEREFLCAVLNNRITNSEEIKNYINYAKQENIEILPPDVNKSDTYFKVENNCIRFGLAALKGLGIGVIDEICEEREKNGEFKSFADFCERVSSQALNKRVLEGLIFAGGFDCMKVKRSQLLAVYPSVVDRIVKDKRIREGGQIGLFDDVLKNDTALEIQFPKINEFPAELKLKYEKEVTGIYISGHPLDDYADLYNEFSFNSSMISDEEGEDLEVTGSEDDGEKVTNELESLNGNVVTAGGIVTEVKKLYTKNGNKEMCFATIEDLYGSFEIVLFPGAFEKNKDKIFVDNLVSVKGKLSIRDGEKASILVDNVVNWQKRDGAKIVRKKKVLYLKFDLSNEEMMGAMKTIISRYWGDSEVVMVDEKTLQKFKYNQKANPTTYMLNELYGYLGFENVKVVEKEEE